MTSTLKRARKALGRDAVDEALVLLWHELEAARLAGDDGALETIARLATRIAREGDEAQQREAARLLETLEAAVSGGETVSPATARLEGEVSAGGLDVEPGEAAPAAGEQRSGVPLGTILWIVIVIAVLALNLLGGRQ